MLFLVNPGGRKDRKASKSKPRRVARRRKRPAKGAKHSEGIMARRRRSRAKARASAPRRRSVRRRRRSVVRAARVRSNPPTRRRRRRAAVAVAGRRSVRRRFRRNPGLAPSGIIRTLKEGVVDGVTVLAGEIAQNKAVAVADRFVPAMTGAGGIIRTAGLNLGVAVALSLVARKAVPSRSRMIAAGLFARATANILATTPIAPLLGDGAVYEVSDGVSAYPQFQAYPEAFAAYPSLATADVPHAEH